MTPSSIKTVSIGPHLRPASIDQADEIAARLGLGPRGRTAAIGWALEHAAALLESGSRPAPAPLPPDGGRRQVRLRLEPSEIDAAGLIRSRVPGVATVAGAVEWALAACAARSETHDPATDRPRECYKTSRA